MLFFLPAFVFEAAWAAYPMFGGTLSHSYVAAVKREVRALAHELGGSWEAAVLAAIALRE